MTSQRPTSLHDQVLLREALLRGGTARGAEPLVAEQLVVEPLVVDAVGAGSAASKSGLTPSSRAADAGGEQAATPSSGSVSNSMVTNGSSANGAGANGTGARHAHAHGASANGQAPSRTPLATALLLSPIRAGLERVEQRLRRTDDARANLHGVAVAAEAGATAFAPLSNAFLNLIDSGGKRLRPALALLAAQVGVPSEQAAAMAADERVIALAASVEMLHTSSLVHDDVIDGALLRRGAPTLNALWSGGSTVLAGNYMFGTAAQLAAATGHMGVIHLFSDTLNIIVNGELQQLRDRYNYDQPRDSYAQRIYAKTASLFCAATEGAALLAHLPEEQVAALRDYGYHLGMAFQVVDDILDFTGDEETLGKPAGSDLLQGTLTLPFFHYLQAHPQPEALIESLDRARDDGDEEHTAAWRAAVQSVVLDLRQSPAIDAARADAQQWLDAARTALAPFPASPARHAMFGLCDFVLQRTY